MRVRRLANDAQTAKNERRVVWFGSYGVNTDGTAKFFNASNKHDNFAERNTWVRDSLIQRLSVIKHELWYNYQYGMPLVDEGTARVTIDAFVMETVQNHEDVLDITSFSSRIEGHEYHCDIGFTTTFGDDTISL